MVEQSFREFVARKTQEPDADPIDWDQRKNDWLQQLKDLYALMASSLSPFDKEIRIIRKTMQLTEYGLGSGLITRS